MNQIATLQLERDGDTVIAVIAGEVDPSNAHGLSRELTGAVPNDALAVVLDLSDVTYLDSAGVKLLFELVERLEARQQRLVVVVPDDAPARRVLHIVAFEQAAPIAITRAEARDRLGS